MQYGLDENHIRRIGNVLTSFNGIEQAILYGSRAKGNYKAGSDIDITIKGNGITLAILNKISLALDDLLLPYVFDISVYSHLKDPELLEHIDRVGQVIYHRE